MPLATVAAVTGLVVLAGLVVTCAFCIDRERFLDARVDLERRLFDLAPFLGAAVLFFLLKRATHGASVRLSKAIGWDVTGWIYGVEGLFVADLQGVTPDALEPAFSVLYMFGFPYLLATPLVLYVLVPALRTLKELLVAYLLNYVVGAICYTLFVAYGPRVHVSEHVDGTMYDLYPETQELTGAVSSNTDVFPSLHTSLSVVVLAFAWRTRHLLPRWFAVASVVTAGVVLSTMVLGIHWLIDVVAGVLLALWSVAVAGPRVSLVDGEGGDVGRRGAIDARTTEEASTQSDD